MSRRNVGRLVAAVVAAGGIAASVGAAAWADSTPIGALPPGPVTTVTTTRGSLVAVALPRQKESTGLVWRIARPLNARVVSEVSEADVGTSVVIVFRTGAAGQATISFALTRGDTSSKAVKSAVYNVRVTG